MVCAIFKRRTIALIGNNNNINVVLSWRFFFMTISSRAEYNVSDLSI